MELIFAMDLMNGVVVHGTRGERRGYRPLTWGLSPSAEPLDYVRYLRPRFLYIADLDSIEGRGKNMGSIFSCAELVERCYLDMGARSPDEGVVHPRIANVFGTETLGGRMAGLSGGYLSIDMKGGKVIPDGRDPLAALEEASMLPLEGCILLDLSSVGTSTGLSREILGRWRSAYHGRLLYGGGARDTSDLDLLASLGYDGAILCTAVHRGRVPLETMRSGRWH